MNLQAGAPRLVLASQSTARRALLESAGVSFETRPAHIDEVAVKQAVQAEGGPAEDAALLLAELKAQRVALAIPEALVIGADQVLVCEGVWFDKPRDRAEARTHLIALRGREHTLATAVVCQRGSARIWHHVAIPRLRMRAASDTFVDAYLDAEGMSVTETVGCYRLEGRGAQLFDSVRGEHAAILGLPLLALLGFLRQHGVLLD